VSRTAEPARLARAYLAVDGGGTKTHAVIVDVDGNLLGRGAAEGCNHRSEGMERALARLRAAVEAASRQAAHAVPFARAWFGLAGVDGAADAQMLNAHLAPFATELRVTNDAELVLAGLRGEPGVALIGGTGAIAIGRDADGRLARVGGWGHLLGDEGSGYDIGRRALQVALQMADGRMPRGPLADLVLSHYAVAGGDELVEAVYALPSKAGIAALAPVVLQAARTGDTDARAIARAGAGELAHAAVTAARLLAVEERPIALAVSGGLLIADAWYRRLVVRRVRARLRVETVSLVADAALVAARALAERDSAQPDMAKSRAMSHSASGKGAE
jgi:N-acetylglucosamine kinase-like BadF-type ATPase